MQIKFESVSASEDKNEACVTEIRLDLSSGKATLRRVADVHCEFPTIPDSLVGAQPLRYHYFPEVSMWVRGSLPLDTLVYSASPPLPLTALLFRFLSSANSNQAVIMSESLTGSRNCQYGTLFAVNKVPVFICMSNHHLYKSVHLDTCRHEDCSAMLDQIFRCY